MALGCCCCFILKRVRHRQPGDTRGPSERGQIIKQFVLHHKSIYHITSSQRASAAASESRTGRRAGVSETRGSSEHGGGATKLHNLCVWKKKFEAGLFCGPTDSAGLETQRCSSTATAGVTAGSVSVKSVSKSRKHLKSCI